MYQVVSKKSLKNTARFLAVLFILTTLYLLLYTNRAHAFDTMSNDNYILQMGNLNSIAGKPSGPNNKLRFTSGETASGLYSGARYKVRAGFEYISSIIPFSFSIDQTTIDFGTLSATNPVTRTSTLTVSNSSANGYAVTAYENHELLVPSTGALIPDTTCDSGVCSETNADAWTNTLTYGFGYRCDNLSGTDCASGFSNANNFKQFADSSKNEQAQAVMAGANSGRNIQTQITYKVNISGTQPAGSYSNQIIYIATPTF